MKTVQLFKASGALLLVGNYRCYATAATGVMPANVELTGRTGCKAPVLDEETCRLSAAAVGLDFTAIPQRNSGCEVINGKVNFSSEGTFSPNNCNIESKPCFCAVDDIDPLPVCESGAFQPDLNKYYVIENADNTVLASTSNGNVAREYRFRAGDRHHWRFLPQEGGGWLIRNRATGMDMTFDSIGILKDEIIASLAPSGTGKVFGGHCENGNESRSVFLETNEGANFPRDCCGVTYDATYQFKDTHRNPAIDTRGYRYRSFSQALLVDDIHIGIEGMGSGLNRIASCVKKSRSCQSMFGPDCIKIDRTTCGFFNSNHALACLCPNKAVPIGAKLKQSWRVNEVQDFVRAGGLELVPVGPKSSFSSSVFASDHLAAGLGSIPGKELTTLVLTSASGGLAAVTPMSAAFTSVLVPLGVDFVFGEEPSPFEAVQALADEIDDALDSFAREINQHVTASIDSAFARDDADDLNDATKTQRRNFLNVYARSKQDKLPRFNRGEISEFELLDGRGDALVLSHVLADDISNIVGFDNPPIEENAKRAAATFDLMKLGWVEVLNMAREAVIVRAYADKMANGGNDLNATCGGAVFDFSTGLVDMADTAGRMLQESVELLVAFLVDNRTDDRFQEMEFDIRVFSYPSALHLQAFEVFVDETLDLCLKVLGDDAIRAAWVNDANLAEA